MGNCNSCDCETDLFRGIDAARLCGSYIETEGESERSVEGITSTVISLRERGGGDLLVVPFSII